MPTIDFLIIGAGLTGATIARDLTDSGARCLVVEKRSAVAGNCHDQIHLTSGIRYHTYGPHLFRTKSQAIWDYVQRFADFYEYRHQVKTWVNGNWENWPVSGECIARLCGGDSKPALVDDGTPAANFRIASLRKMPAAIYESFIKNYTEKQWSARDTDLGAELAGRFHIAQDNDPHLHPQHRFQGLPRNGFTAMVHAMLDGIDVVLNVDWLTRRTDFPAKHIIYTGPVDRFFDAKYGELKYRGQRYENEYLPGCAGFQQPATVCNYPNDYNFVRITEWKRLAEDPLSGALRGSLLTREYPFFPTDPDDFAYPFPDKPNRSLAERYLADAEKLKDVTFCGRLGRYCYYDMDQAIADAQAVAEQLIGAK
ncbi:MAG: FAD-dependent oxidoreductase [Planctomycetota bacterium]